jgi:hypothetical protein
VCRDTVCEKVKYLKASIYNHRLVKEFADRCIAETGLPPEDSRQMFVARNYETGVKDGHASCCVSEVAFNFADDCATEHIRQSDTSVFRCVHLRSVVCLCYVGLIVEEGSLVF